MPSQDQQGASLAQINTPILTVPLEVGPGRHSLVFNLEGTSAGASRRSAGLFGKPLVWWRILFCSNIQCGGRNAREFDLF